MPDISMVQSSLDAKLVRRRMRLLLNREHTRQKRRMVSCLNTSTSCLHCACSASSSPHLLIESASPFFAFVGLHLHGTPSSHDLQLRHATALQWGWGLLAVPLVPLLVSASFFKVLALCLTLAGSLRSCM